MGNRLLYNWLGHVLFLFSENGPISAIGGLGVYDNTSQEQQPETDETNYCTTCDDHLTFSDIDVPQPHIAEIIESSRVASESEPSPSSKPRIGVSGTSSTSEIGTGDRQQSEKRLKRKRKHHSHK